MVTACSRVRFGSFGGSMARGGDGAEGEGGGEDDYGFGQDVKEEEMAMCVEAVGQGADREF